RSRARWWACNGLTACTASIQECATLPCPKKIRRWYWRARGKAALPPPHQRFPPETQSRPLVIESDGPDSGEARVHERLPAGIAAQPRFLGGGALPIGQP